MAQAAGRFKTSGAYIMVHHEIWAVFVQACALQAPFFAESKETPAMLRFGMAHMLNGRFPSFPSAEAYIAVSAIERLQLDKRLHRVHEQESGDPAQGAWPEAG